jgi:diguanylate cyclase (GGDEF)-like protein
MLNGLKNLLIIPVPESLRAEFKAEQNRANMEKVRVIALTFFTLGALMIIIKLVWEQEQAFEIPGRHYLVLYAILMVGMLLFWSIFARLDKDVPRHQKSVPIAVFSFSVFLLFWCLSITLLDQLSYGQIIVYQTAVITIAVLPLFQPYVFFLLYSAVQATFIILLPFFQQSDAVLYGHYMDSTLYLALAFVICRVRFRTWMVDFNHRITIRGKMDEIQRMNRELAVANQQLQTLSQTDSLTGVCNRAMFDKTLKAEWDRCRRYMMPISIFMTDIDYFKSYNDNYGHQEGDNCIRQIAGALSAVAKRSSDMVARYGGAEFSVILPYMDENKAMQLAHILKSYVHKLEIPQHFQSCRQRYHQHRGQYRDSLGKS